MINTQRFCIHPGVDCAVNWIGWFRLHWVRQIVDRAAGNVIDARDRFGRSGGSASCRECGAVANVYVMPKVDHRRRRPWPQPYWLCDEHAESE